MYYCVIMMICQIHVPPTIVIAGIAGWARCVGVRRLRQAGLSGARSRLMGGTVAASVARFLGSTASRLLGDQCALHAEKSNVNIHDLSSAGGKYPLTGARRAASGRPSGLDVFRRMNVCWACPSPSTRIHQ